MPTTRYARSGDVNTADQVTGDAPGWREMPVTTIAPFVAFCWPSYF